MTDIKEQRIEVNGLTIAYLQSGPSLSERELKPQRPPLVLLHGTGESALDWKRVLPQLGAVHPVYAVDFPGTGHSSKPDRIYSIDFLTRVAFDFLTALQLEPAVLVGNSLGGLVALRLALTAPEKVAALILVDSAGLGRAVSPLLAQITLPGFGDVAIALTQNSLSAPVRVWARAALLFANPLAAPPDWLKEQEDLTCMPGFLAANLSALRSFVGITGQHLILLDDLPQLQMPTQIIWGENDLVLPRYQADAAIARLPQGQLDIIPNAGHIPPLEQPDRFVKVALSFLHQL